MGITNVVPFQNFITVKQRFEGLQRFQIFSVLEDGNISVDENHFVAFPEASFSCEYQDNAEFDTDYLRLKYSSPVTPQTVYDYDMTNRSLLFRRQKEVQGEYDPSKYVVERIHATAEDGSLIPISLVRKKDLPMDGTAKCLLYGYGAYGESC